MVVQKQDMNKGHRQHLRERFISDLGDYLQASLALRADTLKVGEISDTE